MLICTFCKQISLWSQLVAPQVAQCESLKLESPNGLAEQTDKCGSFLWRLALCVLYIYIYNEFKNLFFHFFEFNHLCIVRFEWNSLSSCLGIAI